MDPNPEEIKMLLRKQLSTLANRGEMCILCDKKADMVGAFFHNPDKSEEYGAPKGKGRIMCYSICSEHTTPFYAEEVERKLALLWKNHPFTPIKI